MKVNTPPRSRSQIARDRRRISDLYLRGALQEDIASELGLSQPTVSRDIKALQKAWQKSSLVDIDKKKAEELAKIDDLEREYWAAWKRSCLDAETTRKEAIKSAETDPAISKVVKTAKGQSGDPRYLSGVQWCIEKRCKIIGIDAPDKHEHTGPGGAALEAINVNVYIPDNDRNDRD